MNGTKYRFYSSDSGEPPHIHAVQGTKKAKVWLASLETAKNQGYTDVELRRILNVVGEHQAERTGAFNDFFGV
ncbi:MAG: DUF4160 domain-containing protein [Pseudomonadota bacterium]